MKASEALEVHRTKLRHLAAHYGMSRVRVFGSALTRTDTKESDLDLLLDPLQTTLFTLAGFQSDAEELFGVKVSVLAPNGLPPKFRARVLAQAAPL